MWLLLDEVERPKPFVLFLVSRSRRKKPVVCIRARDSGSGRYISLSRMRGRSDYCEDREEIQVRR